MYEVAIKKEQAKLSKKANKCKTRAAAAAAESSSSDNSSDSEMSAHIITPVRAKRRVKHPSKKRAHAKKKTTVEILDEEKNYQNTVQWLQDYGDTDKVFFHADEDANLNEDHNLNENADLNKDDEKSSASE